MSESTIIIDNRPILRILLERTWRFFALMGLFALMALYLRQEPWDGLSVTGYRALGAFFLCTSLWLTQLIPASITGLLAVVIVPLLGVLPTKEAYSFFGNEAVFFILGAFILAAAMMKTGLSTRLAVFLLKRSSQSPRALVFCILYSTAFFSCLMSEHAVAAFFFPIVLEISQALEYEPEGGEYGKTLFLAMAWGCIIGGIVTILGGARAPLAIGIMKEMTGRSLGFFDYMRTSVFVATPLFLVAYGLLTRFFKTDVTSVDGVRAVLEKKNRQIGAISFKELTLSAILILSILGWSFLGETYGLGNIAIIAVVALFVFDLVEWKDIEAYVNWGIVLMYGGAIVLGKAVDGSGALEWLSVKVLVVPQILSVALGGAQAFWLVAILCLAAIFLTEMFSNAAVVALMLPIAIKMAMGMSLPAESMVSCIAIASGLGFIMPMGTPAIALAYSSGYLKVRDIAFPGLMLNLTGWLAFVLTARFLWPVFAGSR